MTRAALLLAGVVTAAGAFGCETEPGGWPVIQDAAPYDAAPTPYDAGGDGADSSSTLSDGRVVTGARPTFASYARDLYQYDSTTMKVLHTLSLIRSDGAIVVPGCSGQAKPAELAAFVDVATDLATVESLREIAPCTVAGGGDYVTMTYVDLGVLKQSASCDTQLKALTAAGDAVIHAVCARADAGTDGP